MAVPTVIKCSVGPGGLSRGRLPSRRTIAGPAIRPTGTRDADSACTSGRPRTRRSGRPTLRSTCVPAREDARSSSRPTMRCRASALPTRASAAQGEVDVDVGGAELHLRGPRGVAAHVEAAYTLLHDEEDSKRSRSPPAVTTGSRFAKRAPSPASAYRVAATSAPASSPAATTSGPVTKPLKNTGPCTGLAGVMPSAVARSSRDPAEPSPRADCVVRTLNPPPVRTERRRGCAPAPGCARTPASPRAGRCRRAPMVPGPRGRM